MAEDNTNFDTFTTEARDSSRFTNIIGFAVIVCCALVAFLIYTIHRRDYLSANADSWAKGFIRSSPVVERQLGHVRNVNRINESHLSGNQSGWYIDYSVSGRRGKGTVVVRMNKDPYDDWDIPSAQLREDHGKPINLR